MVDIGQTSGRGLPALTLMLLLSTCSLSTVSSARILPALNAQAPESELPRARAVPSDAELERLGARIGGIRFNARQLFEVQHADEDSALTRAANRLHITTRQSTIEDQLLFKPGDRYRAQLL